MLLLLLRRASAALRHFILAWCFLGLLVVPALSLPFPVREDWRDVAQLLDPTSLGTMDSVALQAKPGPLPVVSLQSSLADTADHELGASTTISSEPITSEPGAKNGRENAVAVRRVPPAAEETAPGELRRWNWAKGSSARRCGLGNGRSACQRRKRPRGSACAVPSGTLTLLVVVWCGGVLFVGLRTLLGQMRLRRVLQATETLSEGRFMWIASRAVAQVGLACPVRFLESTGCSMPMTCGVLRPVVILPTSAQLVGGVFADGFGARAGARETARLGVAMGGMFGNGLSVVQPAGLARSRAAASGAGTGLRRRGARPGSRGHRNMPRCC